MEVSLIIFALSIAILLICGDEERNDKKWKDQN